MTINDQPTCGKGLAENSVLPEQISKVVAAMAENLETHMQALDLTDKNSSAEYAVYESLVKELKQSALRLHLTANQMAGYHDLPMGRHNMKEMTHPRIREAFEKFMKEKRDLFSLLERTMQRDNQILDTMPTSNKP